MIIDLDNHETSLICYETVLIRHKGAKVTVQATPSGLSVSQSRDENVVQIDVGFGVKLSYSCPGAKVGDLVRINEGVYEGKYHRVVALGRSGYDGPLKRAEVVPS